MKTCTRCLIPKGYDELNKRKGTKDGFQPNCRECQKTQWTEQYAKNQRHYINRSLERRKQRVSETREQLLLFFKDHPCVDCGENDPVVLEFDHINAEDKSAEIGNLIANGHSWENILKEIEKCEVRCCNCHRRRTASQLGWWQAQI